MPEKFFCLDCHFTGSLSRWGYCERCGSNSVVSDQLENRILEQFPKRVANESYSQWIERLKREAGIIK